MSAQSYEHMTAVSIFGEQILGNQQCTREPGNRENSGCRILSR
jgi:hypothetical protein